MTTESTGCAKGCGIIAIAVTALFVLGLLFNAFTGGPDEVRVTGEIEVSDPSACRDPKVKIRPDGHGERTIEYDVSSWRPGQTCTLPIDIDLPKADRYRVEVPGVGVETVPRSTDNSVLIRLSW